MNQRRKFFKKMFAGTVLASLSIVPFKTSAEQIKLSGYLTHHVFFWLKDPNNPQVRGIFEKAIDELLKVETIRQSHFGIPASTEKRDVVDNSYTYSYLLFFDSKEGQDIYQTHPLHVKFVEENSHLWEKVIVYDSTDKGIS
jgi:hypothetical protein